MSILQTKLITRVDICKYLQISKSVNEEKLNEIIIKVQILEILPLLGQSFYNDLVKNVNLYNLLLEGGSYTVSNVTYQNYGLKSCIVHYVDAYYKMFGDITDTPFGLVNKLNGNESKQVDYAIKKSLYNENKKVAYNIWLNVENYLIKTQNSLYLQNQNICKNNLQNLKISKII
jgi:hypothetical protein